MSSAMRTGLVTLLALCLLLPQGAAAKIFKYVDEQGHLVFVDDESKVPERFREKVATYAEELDHLSPAERAAVLEERRRGREAEDAQRRAAREAADRAKYLDSLRTRVAIYGNSVLVPVDVTYGGKTARLMLVLDTGAQMTVFHADAVARLDLAEGERGYGRGVGGFVVPYSRVKFRSVKVGPFEEREMSASVIENRGASPHDGLLGMDFLMKHHYRIDYANQMILWEPQG